MGSATSVLYSVAGSLSLRLPISKRRHCLRHKGTQGHEPKDSERRVSKRVTATHEGGVSISIRLTSKSAQSIQ